VPSAREPPTGGAAVVSTLVVSSRGRTQPDVVAAIAAGGALGAPARYGVAQLIHAGAGGFPWATFWTNVSGSLVLGFILILVIDRFPPTRYVRAFFATGFLGAFTTFSTFSNETIALARVGRPGLALLYVSLSIVGGLGAAAIGYRLA
jgi:CrcB protein